MPRPGPIKHLNIFYFYITSTNSLHCFLAHTARAQHNLLKLGRIALCRSDIQIQMQCKKIQTFFLFARCSGPGCSNVGQRFPPGKSLLSGLALGKPIALSTGYFQQLWKLSINVLRNFQTSRGIIRSLTISTFLVTIIIPMTVT